MGLGRVPWGGVFLSVTEALIREIRSLPNAPALLVLHTVPASSANCNLDLLRWQRPLLLYYHVPVLSYLRAISAEFDGLGGHARRALRERALENGVALQRLCAPQKDAWCAIVTVDVPAL